MKKIIDPFTINLPSLDLHGLDRILTKIKVEEFIRDNVKLKHKQVLIIHGIGEGILRREVYKILKTNKYVEDFNINGINVGATIVNLKID